MSTWTIDLPDCVVVTGTASGLGLECAKSLLAAGSRVIGVDLAAPEAGLAEHPLYLHLAGSVTDQALWDRVAESASAYGGDTSLGYIGSAAVLSVDLLENESMDSWRRTWEINVLGNVLGLKTLLPQLKAARHASVVVVSSIDADFGEQQLASYASSKAALSGAVRAIALDYARHTININLLAPGPMRAGLFNRHLASAEDPQKFLATREARQPKGRITGADEVANAALFLLSSQASAVFGTTLVADGGLTAGFDFRTGEEGSTAAPEPVALPAP